MKTSIKIPHFIIKKSKQYYYNTISGKYIHADHLQQYISDNQPKPDTRKSFWWTDK